ncbi:MULTISPECIES: flagellar hook-associated protein FlgK [unclassified Pseudomonas]|uniref:flagellar hook-associated protein FlgK n=1 Tax=unclassified Pseudomonas TaxID=196821 RepID=UPI000DAC755C|nr:MULTISPECIES: flagellar hook-associated protein FlgK [unclassified Pseudomonas]MBD9654426.1 flagellar hook-associated protein FlgK [Pseudomonas sp. PDM12]PZW44499.1 flagellar hook-associated protein 1 FlgK [Pseudomonas sp. URMO17WK12:I2]
MADLLNIGLSGLAANKTSLAVTGHNITNINTPGFSRQDTIQATRTPEFSGAGYIGSGTSLVDIRRSYSEFLTTQLRSSTALSSDVKAYKSQIDQLDALLAGSTTGVTPSLQKFFSSLQTAAEDPSNLPARQLVLSEAEGLSRRFNTVYDRLNEQNSFANKQMGAVTEQINRLSSSIASLNDSIAIAQSNGSQPNDLLDAREEALRQLSTFVGVNVVAQNDGTQNVFIGSGQPLVIGNNAARLEVVPGANDPNRSEIQFIVGASRQTITTQVTGGELGGILRYREEVLDKTFNSLGRLALSISDQVNSQLGQGLDLKGQVGTKLFGDFNEESLARLRVLPSTTNSSNASPVLNISNSSLLTTSDYRLEFDGTNYSARRLSDNQPMTVTQNPAGTLSFQDSAGRNQGFQVVLGTPAPAAGDSFVLQPTRIGASTMSTVLDQADQLAFAAPVRAEANLQNRGNGVISQPTLQSNGSNIDPAALKAAFPPITLTYDSAAGNFTGLPAGATLTRVDNKGQPITPAPTPLFTPGQQNTFQLTLVDGTSVNMSLSGRPENGDRFNIGFNQNGVSDNRNALALVGLQSKQVVGVDPTVTGIATGSSFTDSYGDLIERVGTLTAQARQDNDATGAILKQAQDNRDSLSAVNLDEEAANLIKFEQYYNASAQVIQVARSLFDTLIGAFR